MKVGPWGGHLRYRKLPLQSPGDRDIRGQDGCYVAGCGVCGDVAIDKGIKVDGGQITQEVDHTCHTKETELGSNNISI